MLGCKQSAFKNKLNIKINNPMCFIKHYTAKARGGVEIQIRIFLNSTLEGSG
jgi:hypothetical protein